MSYNVKNYNEQGGEKTVIGGVLEVLPGATIKADDGATVEGFGGGEYDLPPATENTLGGVKVGEGLSVEEDGTLSCNGGYELPIATQDTLGGVKAGTSGPVRIDNDGVVYLTTASCQDESTATDVETLVTNFNALLAKLKTCGLMENS